MCNLVCAEMGRHVHIEDCHVENVTTCSGNDEFRHIDLQLLPSASRHKDFVTHHLFSKRSGEDVHRWPQPGVS